VNALAWLHPDTVLVDLDPRSLAVLHQGRVHSWALDYTPTGTLSEACTTRLQTELPAFLSRRPWQPRLPARCTLPAGGVSLRRWQLPRVPDDELQRVVRLRLESDLPLPPEELAWGWMPLESGTAPATCEILVAAVRRRGLEEIARLLSACGLQPSFTLGALARLALVPPTPGPATLLTLGPSQSEWLATDAGGPTRLRVLPWGEETVAHELVARAGMSPAAAAALLARRGDPTDATPVPGLESALQAAVEGLLAHLPSPGAHPRLVLAGPLATWPEFLAVLQRRLGNGIRGESLETQGASSASAALRGLQRQLGDGTGGLTLELHDPATESARVLARGTPRSWALAAAALLLLFLALPYAEALLLGPGLAARIRAVKAHRERLELIDREADFLRSLKTDQAPHLETLYLLARTAPPGAKIDSLNLNRKGELSLRLVLRQPPEVTDFRSKLADSGFFSSVVVEEQVPTPDRQKINVRISAQVKPPAARGNVKLLALDPPPATNPPPPGSPAAQP
jgi:Tfp pilus assembly protein PilN